jgi:hypothetical protein
MTDQPGGWAAPGSQPPNQGEPHPQAPPQSGQPQYGPPQYGQPQYGQPQYGPPQWGPPPGPPPTAPKPGVIPLRPLGLGEILDGAISYIRANPVTTLGLSAVVITATQLIQVPASAFANSQVRGAVRGARDPSEAALSAMGASFGTGMLSGLVTFLGVTVLTGLLIVVLGEAVLGRTSTLGEAWARTRGRILGLIGLTLLVVLAIIGIVAVGFLPALLGMATDSPPLALLIFLTLPLTGCFAIYLGVSWSMIPPAYMLEGIPAMTAFARSRGLVRGSWWRVFAILLLANIIAGIIAVIIAVPFEFLASAMNGTSPFGIGADPFAEVSWLYLIVSAIGTIVASTITAPFTAGVTGLLYFDQRIRKEAFDIRLNQIAHPW